jgi:DNA-binding NarL/FixJ family response regulator
MSIRIMCVDDHQVVLEGITSMIDRQDDMEIVGATLSGEEAVRLYFQLRPDVLIVDLQLPGMSGLEVIRTIRQKAADARIIVLTMYQGDVDIAQALKAGATTYVLKDAVTDDLLRIVREVHAGGCPMPPNVARVLATRMEHSTLTAREVEVVELMATGMRNKEIGWSLGISEKTTQVHIRNIMSKLRVNDRTSAVRVAIERGIIHLR